MIVVVCSNMENSGTVGIKEGVSFFIECGEDLACLFLIKRLYGFKEFSFAHQVLSILITTLPRRLNLIPGFQPLSTFNSAHLSINIDIMQDDILIAHQDPTDFLPANYKYLRFLFNEQEYIIPYPHEQLTFRQIGKKLIEQVKIVQKGVYQKLDVEDLQMKLEFGSPIDINETLQDLRIKLCRKNINGIRVHVDIMSAVCDEAALNVFMPAEVDYESSPIEKTFILLNNQQPFYISIKKDEKPQNLKIRLAEVFTTFYAIEVKSADIRFFDLLKNEQEFDGIRWSAKSELNDNQVMKNIKEKETQLIGVQISENLEVPSSQIADQRFLTIRLDSEHALRFQFASIVKYKVFDILKILKLQRPESHSLKIADQIFRPVQLIEQMRKYFENPNSLALNIQATLVSERQTFYSSLDRFSQQSIKPQMVDKSTEKQFTQCVERARSCAESPTTSELDSDEKIRPITFYTGSFRILDQQGPVLLYKGVNELLREQPFGMYQSKLQDYNKEWKYIFAAELIKSIRSLPEYPHKELYRGIPMHQMEGEVGQIYQSKQFLSSTVLENKAKQFIKRNSIGSLLKIRGYTGRYIAPFSIYPEEKEVLFMPYTRFRITQKDTSESIWKISLEEIVDKDYSSNVCTFILWVDDKLKEAKKVIASLNCPIQNSFFVQLVSNKQLREWIESNPSYVKNPRIRIAIITNMKRTEAGTFIQDAGAHTALLARQLLPNCPFIFYIGNIDGTKQALKLNNLEVNQYPITNKRVDLRSFIQKICIPVIEEKQESLLERQKENWLKFFNSQISSTSSQ